MLRYHDQCTAPSIKERDGILLNPALLDTIFCIEAAFVMGDWDSRTGIKRKITRLGVDEYLLFISWIMIGPPYECFFKFCQAR